MFEGVKVLEVATTWPGPAGTAVLADLGADVVRIRPPVNGHPPAEPAARIAPGESLGEGEGERAVRTRSERSIGLDLSKPEGLDLLYEIARCSDVFVVDLALECRTGLGVSVDDLRRVSPEIVYVLVDDAATPGAPGRPQGADPGAMDLAFGVAAALFHREQTGEGAIIDVSALGMSRWASDVPSQGTGVSPFTVAAEPPARVVADTEAVLAELGFRREHILRFKHDGVIA